MAAGVICVVFVYDLTSRVLPRFSLSVPILHVRRKCLESLALREKVWQSRQSQPGSAGGYWWDRVILTDRASLRLVRVHTPILTLSVSCCVPFRVVANAVWVIGYLSAVFASGPAQQFLGAYGSWCLLLDCKSASSAPNGVVTDVLLCAPSTWCPVARVHSKGDVGE